MHWHTGEPAPLEWIKVVLYREFGWTPDELRAVPMGEISTILTCLQEDVKYQNRPKSNPLASSA